MDYVLALHGLKLFLRLLHGHGGSSLQACAIDRGGGDLDVLGHGPFFRQAHEFLVYLNGSSDRDLFSESILKNDGPLREALFSDLNRCWQMYEVGSRTRQLHGVWKGPAIYLGMRRKIGTSYLHGACCGTPSVMPAPTRLGNKEQRDSMIDFFVSEGCLVSRVLVHFQISDHFVISGKVAFSTSQAEPRRQVFDFRRTWDLQKSKINHFFEDINIFELFLNLKVDEISFIF